MQSQDSLPVIRFSLTCTESSFKFLKLSKVPKLYANTSDIHNPLNENSIKYGTMKSNPLGIRLWKGE
jgi:hypothetical protein